MRKIPAIALAAAGICAGLATDTVVAAELTGQQLYGQCIACHSTNGTNGVGPTLKGIVGRASAAVPGFAYSEAMKRAQLKWTGAQLDKYLENPQAVVPGNTMPYPGMKDPAQRTALIAYLLTLK
ncbi:MAG: c-type cytochrome [Pseudomonadota bacterium]